MTASTKMVCVSYDPARGEGTLLTDLTVYPQTPHRPDLPTDIRLYLCVGDAHDVHVGVARPIRIACYGM